MSPSPELTWEGKYDKAGKRVAPVRVALPFQTVETVNESATERQKTLDLFTSGRDTEWRNRLIWGDKKYVLPALLPEFQRKVDLIYIDPPFVTGADFTYEVEVGGESFTKEASAIEEKAYRDTWGRGLNSYLQWFYETTVVLRDLLADSGSIYVHLDWHVGHYAKVVLDEVFGVDNFQNEVVWWYRKWSKSSNRFLRNHDVLYFYSKSPEHKFNILRVPLSPSTLLRFGGKRQDYADDDRTRKITTDEESEGGFRPDVWTQNALPAQAAERTPYPTQKPEALLETVLEASSDPGDLVLDCFVGSGTLAAVAERLGRRWIAADLSRFAIHTTRKRLLSTPGVKPFVVQNLGKYERQAWQAAEFGEEGTLRQQRYRDFILKLYGATPITGYSWLHGVRAGRAIHVGAVDAPVSPGDVAQIVSELKRLEHTADGTSVRNVDVLAWDFAFELNEIAKQQASAANIGLRFFKIPLDVMDPRAVEQGDVKFFELAALAAKVTKRGREAQITLTDFVIPVDDVPADVQKAIKDWVHWIDYWAIDWDNRSDTFHNQWQAYRTKDEPKLARAATHTYEAAGHYRVVVKVIDILGNDTTKILELEVK